MKKISYNWNRTTSCWAAILFYAVCGVLLLLWPNLALSIANYALAVILCAIGVIAIVGYARGSVLDGVLGIQLALGLVTVCFGILLFFNPDFLRAMLPFLWGLSLLIGGFGKVQMSVDLKRIGDKYWWTVLIGAVVSFVLGALAVAQPAFIATVIMQFIGISLLVEAVLDLVAFFTINKKIKAFRKAMQNVTIEM